MEQLFYFAEQIQADILRHFIYLPYLCSCLDLGLQLGIYPVTYSKPSQTSETKHSAKIVNRLKSTNYCSKSFNLDVWLSSEYISDTKYASDKIANFFMYIALYQSFRIALKGYSIFIADDKFKQYLFFKFIV